ncbi:MAG: C69 family dipeptidase [Acidobacteriota bacterium]|jgi:secernin
MCDILLARPDATRNKTVLFGKNSDRPVDDCQVLFRSPRRSAEPGRHAQCSYVSVPDSGEALATIGCRPYWCWGYETGVNEASVVGGNTAIFTRELHAPERPPSPGLTGMDLLRLGLERASSAGEAVAVITGLLERHGQWGSAVPGQDHPRGSYDNAFLLADPKAAWVLETSGRRWVATEIDHGTFSISNEPTIRSRWSSGSDDLVAYARERGWHDGPDETFDFALAYGAHETYSRQVSHLRLMRSRDLLRRGRGSIDVAAMMRALRDHYEDSFLGSPQFHPLLPDFHTLCMHVSPAGFTWGNTATSVVVEVDPKGDDPPHLWVCYLPPCCSLYSAFGFDGAWPDIVTRPGTAGLSVQPATEAPPDRYSDGSLWWRFRKLLDLVRQDPETRQREVREVFDPLEMVRLAAFDEIEDSALEQRQIEQNLDALERLGALWGGATG